MDTENKKEANILKAQKAFKEKEFSSHELTSSMLKVIEEENPNLNAFISVFSENALKEASRADKDIERGEFKPLTGVPIAIKDNLLVKDTVTTAGSVILKSYKASYDATVVKRLKEAGAVIIGKTNLDEFAMGSSTEHSAYGPSKNPYDQERVPGGSSGGSAVAVASGMCLGALGSDTGGSIRQPASFCGVVGFKPTYGAVSRFGLIALASSFDQIGSFAKNIDDARIIFSVIRGKDFLDATSSQIKEQKEKKEISKLIIGVPEEFFEFPGLDPNVANKVRVAIGLLEKAGATIKNVSLSSSRFGLSVYYILMPAEASSNLARYDGIRYGYKEEAADLWGSYEKTRGDGFGQEPLRRIILGSHVLSAGYYDAYYKKAKVLQSLIKDEFRKAFEHVDVILTPTTPTVAFKLGEKSKDPLAMYAQDLFTVPANIAGLPALSMPCGMIDGLPAGLQIISSWNNEQALFNTGKFLENLL